MNLPRRLAEKIEKGNLGDPILRQFVPLLQEKNRTDHFLSDPVQDVTFCKSSKLLQKYAARALIITTGACAMNCRFCFRQNFPYKTIQNAFTEELMLIEQDEEIHEVILSGGDPLSLSNATLKKLLRSLQSISHVRRVRLHTRFPMGIPERLDDELIDALSNFQKAIWCVIHVNHPQEFDKTIWQSLGRLQRVGIPLLTQTVLLKGVNDSFAVLHELFEALIDHQLIPYYLHQLDKVQGAGHFEVPIQEGIELIRKLRTVLPGYAIPHYVQEIPGELSKSVISFTRV